MLSKTDDAFLHNNRIHKGTMTLIEAPQAEALYSKMGTGIEMSGGSAANTVAAFASLGGKSGYIGKIAHDQMGNVFRHDIRAAGVAFDTPPLVQGVPTAQCLILITPDAQRTMCTYLGACALLNSTDLDGEMIRRAKVTYLEGYLFDRDQAKQAFRKAAKLAHAAGRKVALTLSDPFCVERHRGEFLELVRDHVDILFANEAEIKSLYQVDHFSKARPPCELAVITRSAEGSVAIHGDARVEIAAAPVAKVVDTTGAGDAYAAGFLYGYTREKSLADCGRIASLVAAEIISHVGARSQRNLAQLLRDRNAA